MPVAEVVWSSEPTQVERSVADPGLPTDRRGGLAAVGVLGPACQGKCGTWEHYELATDVPTGESIMTMLSAAKAGVGSA